MKRSTRRGPVSALVAGLVLVVSPGLANAQCRVTAHGDAASIRLAQALAANADSPTLRAAYAQHLCNIRKLMHGGGRPCRSGIPLDHVTIRVFGVETFHVFPVRLGDGHYCTTE